MKPAYWRKADNSGMLYPLIMTLSQQSNFRLSAILKEDVDPSVLIAALKRAYDRFPMFKVELNNGLFRACFVENFDEPKIYPDNGVALGRIRINANNGYLIKISYFERNVHAEFFHGLTDGKGASDFFAYLLTEYASIKYGLTSALEYYPAEEGEDEDAYEKYYEKRKGALSSINKNSAQVKGKFFLHEGLGVISGACDFSEIKRLAKEYGVSVTALISAFAIYAAVDTRAKSDKDPSVMIPVNLRRFFPTRSKLNFVCMVNVRMDKDEPMDPRSYASQIGAKLKKALEVEPLKTAISVSSTVAHSPVLRAVPLFVKRALITLGRYFVNETKQTLIVSNLGEFALPDEVAEYVEDVEFLLNCNERTPLNLAVITYKGRARMSFSRHIVETDVERRFFECLRDVGVDCVVRSNYREIRK